MNRRTAIRQVIVISAGTAILPACNSSGDSSIPLKNISINGSQEKMLAYLSETIIPKTNNVAGAGELESHKFLLIMIDDCTSPEQQRSFMAGMNAFEDACRQKFDRSFIKCSPQQKNEWLTEMEAATEKNNKAAGFYETVKRYTIQSFTTSSQYLLDIKKWKMVPGNDFKGCMPV